MALDFEDYSHLKNPPSNAAAHVPYGKLNDFENLVSEWLDFISMPSVETEKGKLPPVLCPSV